MNLVSSFKGANLTFEQQCLSKQADFQFNKFQMAFMKPYMIARYPYKNHEAFVLDYLIIGDNPVLNYFLLKNIFNHIKRNKSSFTKPLNIGLLYQNKSDYWGYHALKQDTLWDKLNSKLNYNDNNKLSYESINDFTEFYNNPDISNLFIIDNKNIQPGHIFKTNHSSEYLIQLIDPQDDNDEHWFQKDQLRTLIKQETRIAASIHKDFYDKFVKYSQILSNLKLLKYNDVKQSSKEPHSTTPMHFLFSNQVFLTSNPFYWIKSVSVEHFKEEENDIFSGEFTFTKFGHFLTNTSFGTAKQCGNEFTALEEQVLFDLYNILTLTLKVENET